MEAVVDGEVVVRAVCCSFRKDGYDFTKDGYDFTDGEEHWIIAFPGIAQVVGHELHEIHVFNNPRLEIKAFAKLIVNARDGGNQ